jgi:hypothetical protein
MSVFQFPSSATNGTNQQAINIQARMEKDITLPSDYTIVPSSSMKVSDVAVPQSTSGNDFKGRLETAIHRKIAGWSVAIKLL